MKPFVSCYNPRLPTATQKKKATKKENMFDEDMMIFLLAGSTTSCLFIYCSLKMTNKKRKRRSPLQALRHPNTSLITRRYPNSMTTIVSTGTWCNINPCHLFIVMGNIFWAICKNPNKQIFSFWAVPLYSTYLSSALSKKPPSAPPCHFLGKTCPGVEAL